MEPDERQSLRGLSEAASVEVYSRAHKTGDPLADYWEYRIEKGLPVDLDCTVAPPREAWDREE